MDATNAFLTYVCCILSTAENCEEVCKKTELAEVHSYVVALIIAITLHVETIAWIMKSESERGLLYKVARLVTMFVMLMMTFGAMLTISPVDERLPVILAVTNAFQRLMLW